MLIQDGAIRHSQVYQRSHRLCTQAGHRNANSTNDREIKVEQNINANINTKQYWRMVLGRLAAKIDIQWDAKGAYEKGQGWKSEIYKSESKPVYLSRRTGRSRNNHFRFRKWKTLPYPLPQKVLPRLR